MGAIHQRIARAIDVGYGHVKFSEGRDEANAIRTDCFPSLARGARSNIVSSPVMQRRDTYVVPVKDRRFEVGKDVLLATGSKAESEVLDHDFALSDGYAARLLGAMNYMLPGLPQKRIDYLVLGLPLNTFFKYREIVSKRFSGQIVINQRGTQVEIAECYVFPQPLGSYTEFLAHTNGRFGTNPKALVVDPGYNTIDWFVCQGLTVSEDRSDATLLGMSAVLRKVANRYLSQDDAGDVTASEIVRGLDDALSRSIPFRLYGKPFDFDKYFPAGEEVIEDAVQSVKNGIGAAGDIDVVVVSGGGAKFYAPILKKKFPKHEIFILDAPSHANVRGFHLMGELLAQSASRAVGSSETANV